MSATRTAFRITDDRAARRLGHQPADERRSWAEHDRPPREPKHAAAAALARTSRLRSLASFLGLDPQIVAEGLLTALERDEPRSGAQS